MLSGTQKVKSQGRRVIRCAYGVGIHVDMTAKVSSSHYMCTCPASYVVSYYLLHPALGRKRTIIIVCLSVRLSVSEWICVCLSNLSANMHISLKPYVQTSPTFLCVLSVLDWFFSL